MASLKGKANVFQLSCWSLCFRRCEEQKTIVHSGDSGMYPYQRTPMGNPYIRPIKLSPRIPREHNKYHGYTVRGTPHCPLIHAIHSFCIYLDLPLGVPKGPLHCFPFRFNQHQNWKMPHPMSPTILGGWAPSGWIRDRITPIYKPWFRNGHLEGVPRCPILRGRNRSPWANCLEDPILSRNDFSERLHHTDEWHTWMSRDGS